MWDLSKSLHPRFLQPLVALLPGLFFVGCVFVGDPELVRGIVARTGTHDRYLVALLVLFGAFLVGVAALMWVRVIQILLVDLYFLLSRWWPKKLRDLVTGMAANAGRPSAPESLYKRTLRWLWHKQLMRNERQRHAQEAWADVALVLLKRYGVEDMTPNGPWSDVLGKYRGTQLRGDLRVVVMHAVGWAGLAARHFAQALDVGFFTDFCLFLIAMGLWQAASVGWYLTGQVSSWIVGLRNTLDELRDFPGAVGRAEGPNGAPAPPAGSNQDE